MEDFENAPDNAEFDSNMNNDEEESYAVAVKCIFGKPKNIMGAFCLLLRKRDFKIVELVVWTSRSAAGEGLALNLFMPWEDFSTKMPSIGPIDKESCEKLKNALKEVLSREMIDNIFKTYSSNPDTFIRDMKELFEATLRYSIKLDLKLELLSQERLKDSGYEREEPQPSSNTNAENVTMSKIIAEQIESQIVYCTAIIDPVNGIAASQLKTGDNVKVVLQKNNAIGTLLSDHYSRINRVPAFPVKEVKKTENGTYVISLEADAGITCVIKTTSDLKLRASTGYEFDGSLSARTILIILGAGVVVFVLALIALIRLLLR